jgi:hypothetical protein
MKHLHNGTLQFACYKWSGAHTNLTAHSITYGVCMHCQARYTLCDTQEKSAAHFQYHLVAFQCLAHHGRRHGRLLKSCLERFQGGRIGRAGGALHKQEPPQVQRPPVLCLADPAHRMLTTANPMLPGKLFSSAVSLSPQVQHQWWLNQATAG